MEDTSLMEDLRSEEKSIEEQSEPFKGQPSYIQEISTVIAESSAGELVK